MAELHITLSDGRTLVHVLGGEPEVIGRDASCEIAIDDVSTSRRHARFAPEADGVYLEDLGSKNGTLVNDRPCTRVLLQHEDRILLGSARVVFHSAENSVDDGLASVGSVIVEDDGGGTSHATRYASPAKELMLSQRRLHLIYELSDQLTTLQGRGRLLERAMDICFDTLQFERGAIGLRRREARGVEWPLVRNLRGTEGELTVSRTLLSRALERGERAIFADAGGGTPDPTVSMVQHGIRSAMCVPLMREDEILGVIYGDRTSSSAPYNDEDIDFLAAIARQVTIGLINCRLMEDQEQMIRWQQSLNLARTIQTGLFPSSLPNREGLRVAALNDPGDHVSGDYYDVIECDDGRVWLLIADVTGEGVAAALLMANLQAAVRLTIEGSEDPGGLLGQWNRQICRNTDGSKFITCVLALFDPQTRTLRFANAGHCPPLSVHAHARPQVLSVVETAFPLGIEEDVAYETNVVEMGPEPFVLLIYTDGVIEAMNESRESFGFDALQETLSDRSDIHPSALVRHVRRAVSDFAQSAKQSDDITLLAAHAW